MSNRYANMIESPLTPGLPRLHMQQIMTNEWVSQYIQREQHVSRFGFVILPGEVLDRLALMLKGLKTLEVGAGTGALTKALHERGVNLTACDPIRNHEFYDFVWHYDQILQAEGTALLPGDFDAVILTWPCLGEPWGHEVLQVMKPGQLLVYEGEWKYGCTANDAFFEELDTWESLQENEKLLNESHLNWRGMHDYWRVFKKPG